MHCAMQEPDVRPADEGDGRGRQVGDRDRRGHMPELRGRERRPLAQRVPAARAACGRPPARHQLDAPLVA